MGNYSAQYQRKLTTPHDAVATIQDGDTLVHGLSIAEPPALLSAVADRVRAGDLHRIKVYSLLPLAHAAKTVLAPDLCDAIEAYTWFVSPHDRSKVKVGLDNFIPNYFHQVPRLCREFMKIDCMVTTVSPMDQAGFFSFGTANDFTSTAARHCGRLIVEVNERMPRVFGDSLLHISEVDAVVENTQPLMELSMGDVKPEADVIARIIAGMVPDGATLQLGFGGIPNAVAAFLTGHKDLGIHTELFVPGMVDLIEAGAVTGKKKTLHRLKNVFTVAQGSTRMYEFMNDNPSMESYPVSYTNEPAVIAQNDRMISINSVLEVDLLGQANAEFLGGTQYSGTGGQLDFVRGAFNAKEGKSILTFYATADEGKISRIVSRFAPGTVVTTPRMDVHYLVTEYGAVNLKGKSNRERALAIISLAHPAFRDQLLREAEDLYMV